MGRKKGDPAYAKKTVGPKTFITNREAWQKIKREERASKKSVSDILTHHVLNDREITSETFPKKAVTES